jgi:hypothetical protein
LGTGDGTDLPEGFWQKDSKMFVGTEGSHIAIDQYADAN